MSVQKQKSGTIKLDKIFSNYSRSNLLAKTVLFLIIVAIVSMLFVGSLKINPSFFSWINYLDLSLNPEMYATLAGLALTTIGVLQNSKSILDSAVEKFKSELDNAAKLVGNNDLIINVKNAFSQEIKSQKEIENLKSDTIEISSEIKVYLKAEFRYKNAIRKAEENKGLNIIVLNAFIIFLIGLIHSLSLDTLFDYSSSNSIISKPEALQLGIFSSISFLLRFLVDIAGSSSIMIYGIIVLYNATTKLKTIISG